MPQNDQALLMRLRDSGLEFVVIGGLCVVYHGVPVATFDLDICCPFGEENVRRIESAMKDLNPFHRLTANKLPLEQTRSSFKDLKMSICRRILENWIAWAKLPAWAITSKSCRNPFCTACPLGNLEY